jgi:disulfide bond formation protein DsbB
MRGINRGCVVLALLSTWACTEQYNPHPYWQKLQNEREAANAAAPTLTPEGKLPASLTGADAGLSKSAAFDPAKVFASTCVACHGADGGAKVNNARDLSDAGWQAEASDDEIRTVIELGAIEASKKLDFSKRSPQYQVSNPLMTPWGPVILIPGSNDSEKKEQLDKMVAYIRGLKK